jgi:hypothetical protein
MKKYLPEFEARAEEGDDVMIDLVAEIKERKLVN